MLAIVLISLFMLSVTLIPTISLGKDARTRVESLDKFVKAVEEDLPRQLFISGFRTVFLMEQDIIVNGLPIESADAVFQESFFNGTYDGTDSNILVGTTFNEILNDWRDRGVGVNVNVSFYNPVLEIRQDDPWNVKMVLSGNLVIEDLSGLALWNKSSDFVGIVGIENFDDPMYLLGTNGVVLNKVVQGNISDLNELVSNSTYIGSITGPNFLQRLEGKFTGDVNGIESLVNLQELSQQGLNVKSGISVVDSLYFEESNLENCQITGMPSWFRLDQDNVDDYNLRGLEYNCL